MGRKQFFELTTLTFEEFVNFKTGYKYSENLPAFFDIVVKGQVYTDRWTG